MEPLVEVVTNKELELALEVKARVIGVNNRALGQDFMGIFMEFYCDIMEYIYIYTYVEREREGESIIQTRGYD